MIEGLKVTVSGAEMRDHLLKRSNYHRDKGLAYAGDVERLEARGEEDDESRSVDPIRQLRERRDDHHDKSAYFLFLAEHVNLGESYLLGQQDLIMIEFIKRWF